LHFGLKPITIVVMRFDHFHQIVEQVFAEVDCPRCARCFEEDLVEIVNIGPKNADFRVRCAHCAATISVSAQLERAGKLMTPKEVRALTRKQESLSPHSVQDISNSLRKFQGQNVKDLFL